MGDVMQGARGMLVKIGLGEPVSRAFVVATVVGIASYASGLPSGSFREDGTLRPLKGVSKSPEATYAHFLVLPVTAGVATFLCT